MRKNKVKAFLLSMLIAVVLGNTACAANLTLGSSSYDTSIDNYTALSDNVDFVLARHINNPLSAIINIENILGTGLKGTQSTLSARLSQMISGAGGINSGTSFPTTPTPINAQLFWRSDLKALYIYDGALGQWQQMQVPATFSFSSPSAFTLTLYHNITAGRTITFPDATDTLVGRATTDTLTNKTIDDANNTLTILEASITDGTLLARLAANETITGTYAFQPASGAPFTTNSTTVVTNLNADTVDGYNPGNGSGNMPVSNGTINTNLNADMWDGYHVGADVSGYGKGMTVQFNSTLSAAPASFDILANIGTAWENIGATGSGATNIWSALDVIPSTAGAVILKFNVRNPNNTVNVYTRRGGSTLGLVDYTRVTDIQAGGYQIVTHIIPITPSGIIFELYREGGATTGAVVVSLIGWIQY